MKNVSEEKQHENEEEGNGCHGSSNMSSKSSFDHGVELSKADKDNMPLRKRLMGN